MNLPVSPIFWDTTYEIVLALQDAHPDIDLDDMGLDQLRVLIVNLPRFADDEDQADDDSLSAILSVWYEEQAS